MVSPREATAHFLSISSVGGEMAYSCAETHLLLPSQGAGQVVLATSLTEGPGRQMQPLKSATCLVLAKYLPKE